MHLVIVLEVCVSVLWATTVLLLFLLRIFKLCLFFEQMNEWKEWVNGMNGMSEWNEYFNLRNYITTQSLAALALWIHFVIVVNFQ